MRTIVPDVINNQNLITVRTDTNVYKIARIMKEKRIAAVLVTERDDLVGIVTERDIATRVVAVQADPQNTTANIIMTREPDILSPYDTPEQAIKMMIERNYRHLPVKDGNKLVGLVSIRDLYAIHNTELKEEINDRNAFIQGESYGLN